MPLFSVIMPTFNRSEIISEPIKSLINQTETDWELIVIDDHGTDNTKKVIDDFRDERIRYYYLDKNLGPSGARNYGIRKSLGEIIVLADSDDLMLPDRLDLTRQAFKNHPEIDIVYGKEYQVKEDGSRTIKPTHEFSSELLKCYDYIANPTTAYKKDVFEKVGGYDKNLRTSEDYDFWLGALEKNANFLLIDEPLVEQKIHAGSIIKTVDEAKRRYNLAYVRKKHDIKTPKVEDVRRLVKNDELLKITSTPNSIGFWFK